MSTDTFQGEPMPKALAYHCALQYHHHVLIYGGMEWPDIINLDAFLFDTNTRTWSNLNGRPDCGIPPKYFKPKCARWTDDHVLISTFNTLNNNTCNSVFDIPTKTWTTKENPMPKVPISGGTTIEIKNRSELLHIGGQDWTTGKNRAIIYHFKNLDQGWNLWKNNEAIIEFEKAYEDGDGISSAYLDNFN